MEPEWDCYGRKQGVLECWFLAYSFWQIILIFNKTVSSLRLLYRLRDYLLLFVPQKQSAHGIEKWQVVVCVCILELSYTYLVISWFVLRQGVEVVLDCPVLEL